MKEYKVKFVKSDGWYAAFVPDIPGAHSQGRTLAEARRNIAEAIELILDSNRKRCRAITRGRKVISDIVHVAA
ncbi:MAG TPA: type II toxin-antitoxin system HicB family antitoxin [bacterium]|nr:type II toxin-antitoxin system HicB family antitoxin [bacterium]